jgi:hypothetical protein
MLSVYINRRLICVVDAARFLWPLKNEENHSRASSMEATELSKPAQMSP